ncbi:MAG: RnfH family protein [Bordetella sp.]|nr:MAG: RnfH family protein [Bordetella sp.]
MLINKNYLLISIYYFYTSSKFWKKILILPQESTVDDALKQSELKDYFEDLDPWKYGVGVFGENRTPTSKLFNGDRIEIYQPLKFDPMESRRRRANKLGKKFQKLNSDY